MNRYDDAISKALADRRDDPAAQTLAAVSIINYLDDLSSLQENTRDELMLSLAVSGHEMRLHRTKIEKLKFEEKIVFPDLSVAEYKKAYQKIIPFYDYQNGITHCIEQAVSASFNILNYADDFHSLRLEEKRLIACRMVFDYLEAFDPHRILHGTSPQGEIPDLVGVMTRPVTPTIAQDRSTACFSQETDKIYYRRYFMALETHDTEKIGYDFEKTEVLFDTKEFPFNRDQFDIDRTFIDDGIHRQYDSAAPHIRYVTDITDEASTAAMLAHEAVHMTLYRCAVLYEEDPEKAEKNFGFTFDDYIVHLVNNAAYENQDKEQYHANKEEIFAYAIQEKVMEARKSSPLALAV